MGEPVAVPKPREPKPLTPREPKPLTPEETPASSASASASTATATASTVPVPAPASGPAPAAAIATAAGTQTKKKRKLEDGEFRNSKYFKIRSILKGLRPHFVDVVRAPDFQNSDAATEIQKQMKIMIELLKELSSETASGGKSKKPHEEQKLSAGAVEEEHEKKKHRDGHAQLRQPQTGGIPSQSENKEEKVSLSNGIPIKKERAPQTSEVASVPDGAGPARKPHENIIETKELAKLLDEGPHGTYVVGGSPIGWNYLVYPGRPPVSYGETKASKLASRAAAAAAK